MKKPITEVINVFEGKKPLKEVLKELVILKLNNK